MLPEERMRTRKRSSRISTEDAHGVTTVKTATDSPPPSQKTIDSTLDLDLPFDANSWREVKEKLESIAWIQCDSPHCRKWRRVRREEVANLRERDKWFCPQNSDTAFSSCDVPEEDVHFYDKLALRSGLKYFKSQLLPGDLVWAKMPGYCSWPAVVTPEPDTEAGHVWREEEEITHYHVEFLGEPHSHGWVCARDVEAFTAHSANRHSADGSHPTRGAGGAVRKGRRGRRKPLCMPTERLKTTYRGRVSVERGVAEAIDLLPVSPKHRLTSCTYLSATELPKRRKRGGDSAAAVTASSTKSIPEVTRGPRKPEPVHSQHAPTPSTTFTTFATSLDNRTKEERLMLDIEMYKRNERAFDHDVTRFMARNGLKMGSAPFWQNQRVALFHLFLAVHERGGFTQVTDHRRWSAVYREVTETPCNTDVHNSRAVKIFYRRYLYPYELYIHGKDFREFVPHKGNGKDEGGEKRRKQSSKSHSKKLQKTTRHSPNQQHGQKGTCTAVEQKAEAMEEDVASDSLMEMIQALEENGRLEFEEVQLEEEIAITFYDDSTPSKDQFLPLMAYEPQASSVQVVPSTTEPSNATDNKQDGNPTSGRHVLQKLENANEVKDNLKDNACFQHTEREAQMVPSVPSFDGKMDDGAESGFGSVFSQQMLRQLDALQEGISLIDNHVE